MAQEDSPAPVVAPTAGPKAVTRLKPRKAAGPKPQRPRPGRVLPTERIAFAKQLDLLRAYAAASAPSGRAVTNKEVAAILKFVESTAVMANAFFVDSGLLQRTDSGFVPSPEVVSFQRAFSWSPETASYKLGPVISRTWFAQAILPRLGVKSMDENEVLTVLGEAASVPPDYKGQIRVLVDYLTASGLIERDGSQVRLRQEASTMGPSAPEPASTPSEAGREIMPSRITTGFVQPTEGIVQFHVEVKVDMKEFAGWRNDRIAAFFAGVAKVLAAKADIEKEAAD